MPAFLRQQAVAGSANLSKEQEEALRKVGDALRRNNRRSATQIIRENAREPRQVKAQRRASWHCQRRGLFSSSSSSSSFLVSTAVVRGVLECQCIYQRQSWASGSKHGMHDDASCEFPVKTIVGCGEQGRWPPPGLWPRPEEPSAAAIPSPTVLPEAAQDRRQDAAARGRAHPRPVRAHGRRGSRPSGAGFYSGVSSLLYYTELAVGKRRAGRACANSSLYDDGGVIESFAML